MRFMFMLVLYVKGGVVQTNKLVYSRHDCEVVAAALAELHVPHLIAGGQTLGDAERIFRNSWRCTQLAGPGDVDAAQAGDP